MKGEVGAKAQAPRGDGDEHDKAGGRSFVPPRTRRGTAQSLRDEEAFGVDHEKTGAPEDVNRRVALHYSANDEGSHAPGERRQKAVGEVQKE